MKFKKLYKEAFINECEKHTLNYDDIMKLKQVWDGPYLFLLLGSYDIIRIMYIFESVNGKMVLTYRNDGVEFFDNRVGCC